MLPTKPELWKRVKERFKKQRWLRELTEERKKFRQSLGPEPDQLWVRSSRQIGVVLSGGGARGAYEAGVLLAFQDARMPTHILAATSVGSINAASYAGHSTTMVGSAESLVDSWSAVTPPEVGIDWMRYILVLGGLVATALGFGNLLRYLFRDSGISLHMRDPKLTWGLLGLTGLAVMIFYDQLPYIGYAAQHALRGSRWKPDRKKVIQSVIANIGVWGFAVFFAVFTHIHLHAGVVKFDITWALVSVGVLLILATFGYALRGKLSVFSHRFLRLPLRTGLFPNFERTRFLRERIPARGLRRSPMRVAMTAASVETGEEKCFVNHSRDVLLSYPGVNEEFVRTQTEPVRDLLLAVIASSAFPIVYETVPIKGERWTDGGIVSNQPIRPAIRLGAEVLFLVLVEPRVQRHNETRTFLDLGVRAIDVLMSQNLKTDLKILNSINSLCRHYAEQLHLRPEQIVLDLGERKYRYLQAFTVEPAEPLQATVLDFDGNITVPAILQGYKDGQRAVKAYAQYLETLPLGLERHHVKLVAETMHKAASK